jgi:hypothetical protein
LRLEERAFELVTSAIGEDEILACAGKSVGQTFDVGLGVLELGRSDKHLHWLSYAAATCATNSTHSLLMVVLRYGR